MAHRRFHYDLAFEYYLRDRAIPYVAVDEAKRALFTCKTSTDQGSEKTTTTTTTGPNPAEPFPEENKPIRLKNFDFVVYNSKGRNLLVDVKGRKHSGRRPRSFDNWVTRSDVHCLSRWQTLFGEGFDAAFAFLYWCEREPPGVLFQEVFQHGDRWYTMLAVRLSDYREHLRTRSPRWGTVSIPADQFAKLSTPLKRLI